MTTQWRWLVVFAVTVSVMAAGLAASPRAAERIAIVGGRVITQSPAGIVEGTVLIEDGKIKAVGPTVAIPEGTRRIDVTGMIVTPGLIDARSTLFMHPAARTEAAADATLDVLDALDPYDDDWIEVVRQGVTAVSAGPSSAGTFGGRAVVLNAAGAATLAELVIQKDAALHAAIGVGPSSETPFGRRQQYESIKKAFQAARKYEADRKQYEADRKKAPEVRTKPGEAPKPENKAPGAATQPDETTEPLHIHDETQPQRRRGQFTPGQGPPTKTQTSDKPTRDPAKEFILQALGRKVPVRIEAHRADDVQRALRLADEFGLRLVVEGATQAGPAADELRTRRVALVLGPLLDEPAPPAHRKDAPFDWPSRLVTDDTVWALGTFAVEGRDSKLLRAHAAAAVARGIAPDSVLRALTRGAATLLGVADRLGTIEPGKQADLAVFAGDPLDPAVPAVAVLVRGRVVYEADAATRERPTRSKGGASQQSAAAKATPLPAALPARYALRSERVLDDSGQWSTRSVAIADGRIVACRSGPAEPNDGPVFDLGGHVLTPGLIAAQSDLGQAAESDEPAESDSSHLRALDVLDLQNAAVRRLRAGGVVAAVLTPSARNVLSGCCAAVRLDETETVLRPEAGERLVLAASARRPDRYPASLAGQIELLDRTLAGMPRPTDLFLPNPVGDTVLAERRQHIESIRSGRCPAFLVATTATEAAAALRIVERHKLRGVLVATEAIEPLVPELKRLGVPLVVRPVQPGDYDRYVAGIVAAGRAGVPVAVLAGTAAEMRLTVAWAMNHGLPLETALRTLTADAAKMVGIDSQVGVIAAGRVADLVVWNGPPTDLRSKPVWLIHRGRVVTNE
jgi:imidazolonepropionase-like amidohydrolase